MKTMIITYDLHKVGQNYDCLKESIKSYGTWCHPQGSVWLIRTTSSASQVRDKLKRCLDGNDKLFVAALTGEAAWIGHSDVVSNWIKENA